MLLLEAADPTGVVYPMWALVVVLILGSFKHYLPTINEIIGVKKCKSECEKLKKRCDDLTKENKIINRKYLLLTGAMSVIRDKLAQMGFSDLPNFDNLNDEQKGEGHTGLGK